MILISILITLCCFAVGVIIYLAWKLYNFSLIIIDMEDAIEESLDLLDTKYNRMYEILQKPIFFDSTEVRQVVSDIRECQNAILIIANKLTRQTREIEDSGEKKNKED